MIMKKRYNTEKQRFDSLSEMERVEELNKVKKEIMELMAKGFSYTYASSFVAKNSKVQRIVILKEISKDNELMIIRNKFIVNRREQRKNFIKGIETEGTYL